MFNESNVVNALKKYYQNTRCKNVDIYYTSHNSKLPGLHIAQNFQCHNKYAVDELVAEIDMIVNELSGKDIKLVNSETNEIIFEFEVGACDES